MEISYRSMSLMWALFTSSLPFLSTHSWMVFTTSSGFWRMRIRAAAFRASRSTLGSSSLILDRPKEMF